MKKHVEEELGVLIENKERLAQIIADSNLSEKGMQAAEELLTLLQRIENIFHNDSQNENEIDALVENMPLLYLQIRKIN